MASDSFKNQIHFYASAFISFSEKEISLLERLASKHPDPKCHAAIGTGGIINEIRWSHYGTPAASGTIPNEYDPEASCHIQDDDIPVLIKVLEKHGGMVTQEDIITSTELVGRLSYTHEKMTANCPKPLPI